MQPNTPSTNPQRYSGIDALKCLCAFMILALHVGCTYYNYYTPDSDEPMTTLIFTALTRVSVPTFFTITGFFFEKLLNEGRLGYHCRKIAIWLLVAIAAYLLVRIGAGVWKGRSITDTFRQFFTIDSPLRILVLPAQPLHLWYLLTALETMGLLWIARGKLSDSRIFLLIPILLCGTVALSYLSETDMTYRNAIFMGLPYMLLGILLKRLEPRIRSKIKQPIAFGLVLCGMLALFGEVTTLKQHELNTAMTHFISTPILCAGMMIAALTPIAAKSKILSHIGRKYSMHIYLWHFMVMAGIMYLRVPISGIYLIDSLIIFAMTLCIVAAATTINKKLIRRSR